MSYPTAIPRVPGPKERGTDQRLESLAGRNEPAKRAVTREDASGLGLVRLTSSIVSAAPSAAEHNALVADIHALAAVLNLMGAKFTGF